MPPKRGSKYLMAESKRWKADNDEVYKCEEQLNPDDYSHLVTGDGMQDYTNSHQQYFVQKIEEEEASSGGEQVVLEESEVCESLSVAQDEGAGEQSLIEIAPIGEYYQEQQEEEQEEQLAYIDENDQHQEEGEYVDENNQQADEAYVDENIEQPDEGYVDENIPQPEEYEEEGDEVCQTIVIQHMDISEPMSVLRELLQRESPVSLDHHEFWLRDSVQLDQTKSLATQCTQANGLVQVNIEIKNGSQPRINIMDILRAASNDTLSEMQRIQKFKQRPKCRVKISGGGGGGAGGDAGGTHDNAIARWVVDQEFKDSMEQQQMPKDPLLWDETHVRYWLHWASNHFNLDGLDIDNLHLVGTDLYSMTLEDFNLLVPNDADNLFWTHLELLRKCKFAAINQPTEVYEDESRRYPGVQGRGNRSGNNGQIQLWQFLLELLTDSSFVDCIQWVGDDGEFKLNNHEQVAKLWGQRKNKPNMNYEKLSRALRYYYDGEMISKVPGKRFTYKFICDLKALIGFTPSDIQRLVVSPTVHIEVPQDSGMDTDRARLEQLRETLRVPGIMKRTSNNIYQEQEGQMLIIDGTS